MTTPFTLEHKQNAPLLNPHIDSTQKFFRTLLPVVGGGNAIAPVATNLSVPPAALPGSGELQTSYSLSAAQADKLETDLSSLNASVADVTAKSATVANKLTMQTSGYINDVKDALDTVPDENPSVPDQIRVSGALDGIVSKAQNDFDQAYGQLNANSDAVRNDTPVTDGPSPFIPIGYNSPSDSGNAANQYVEYAPVNPAGSGSYVDEEYENSGLKGKHIQMTPAQLATEIGKALDYLGITDPIARQNWTNGYITLITRESGGDPDSVNTSDSNARAGHPSQGLTQTIPGTFLANLPPGASLADITNPKANIIASMNYVMHEYNVHMDGSNLAERVQQADPNRSPKGY
ncbi:transglycosylase SLT domain-containing protein [Nocardia heshunensis]